ncbi:PhzF family phenazine biosynthesis protein [Sulfitobacter mediterraneus]|uniref:PhzF family phenazine biosynthesis protein n=1 Tax=Sulfitobacter mediterraneus TaxID=83219 RepID=UPI00193273BF|nr:PhzF family phenazine biosynthesis protein [Sulfitobacter mediterraneus]MBM1632600.1 PhzF family phenazine biosynthesis protein [Sulfitobacter mediterraneus]MBM1641266.1 PhzF family phenazine biosynthesis protein [Sulfitobacter mediterraneus]MBM1644465.1 PhzF family phenazine biosynthesis protein [Sulfitobacter mediterraneus]MBM1649386.1 PhzF family phenazine biosynthesis protein [Sulfitobacter mediterraneus]MBM1653407.1 PhzF family phenazine biosynthesis protein [Sulfitobacter mediterraneu
MKRRFIQCDVFSDTALRGNGLAVVLDGAGLSDAQMMQFAIWTNQAETTFLVPPQHSDADYGVRIFSPSREMDFAGHPTLGSCAAWLHAGGVPKVAGRVMQECAIGLVEIDLSGTVPAFVAPPTQIDEADLAERDRIAAALGLSDADIAASARVNNGAAFNLIELRSAERVLSLDARAVSAPEFRGVAVLGKHPGGAYAHYESRNLTPASLMAEDPITGSMNAAIAVWLKSQGRLADDIVIAQGTAIGRNGRVFVSNRGADVMIGGATTIVIEGTVEI